MSLYGSLNFQEKIYDKGGKTISGKSMTKKTRQPLQQMVLGTLDSYMCERKKLEHSLIPHTKIDSKWIQDLIVKPVTIKLLEENTGRILFDINHSTIFLDQPPRVMNMNTNKWNLLQLKNFFTAKGITNKMKRQSTQWEKTLAVNQLARDYPPRHANSSCSSVSINSAIKNGQKI